MEVSSSLISSPAAQRNKGPILNVIKELQLSRLKYEEKLHVVEVASGTGEHAAFFASQISNFIIQPSDILTEEMKKSIEVSLFLAQ